MNNREMITSPENPKIKEYSKLLDKKNRDRLNLFIVEGFHMVEEAKKSNLIVEILTSDETQEGTLVGNHIIKKLSNSVTPQPIIAICKKPVTKEIGNKVLFLNNIQDPGNVGTLIRTARAFNFDTVLLQGADPYSDKALRSSQGAIFSIDVISIRALRDINVHGFEIIGAILDPKAINYKTYHPSEEFILVLGNEGNGIDEETKKLLTKKVYIPINFESLNVSAAGAILMNEYK